MKKQYILIGLAALLLLPVGGSAAIYAKTLTGITEVGNNSGFSNSAFEDMLRSVGWTTNESWCMFFAKAVYLKAFPSLADQIHRMSGSTQGTYDLVASGALKDFEISQRPHRGDIAIWTHINNPSQGHAGIVLHHALGVMRTVEGNASGAIGFAGDGDVVGRYDRPSAIGSIPKNTTLKLKGFIHRKSWLDRLIS